MQVFEVKTNKSDYPYLVIADGFKQATEVLYQKGIYDTDIVSIQQQERYKSDHILIEETLTAKELLEKEVRRELAQKLPHWKKMPDGAAGGDREHYLIRSSKGYYFTASCIGGAGYYLDLDSLEQLPGLPTEETNINEPRK